MGLFDIDRRRLYGAGIAGIAILLAGAVHASGFALIEQSVSSMGTAYANGSSGMDDASTIFFNPASMSRLEGNNVSGGLHVLRSSTDFSGKGFYNPSNSAINLVGLGGVSTGNNRHDDIGLTAAVPHGGFSHQLNENMWLGLSINAPFGLKTHYDNDWVGRYHAIKSELKTVNINPSLAYEINDKASVGIGVSALYADGKLTNAVDGGLSTLLVGGVPPGSPPFFWVPGSSTLDSKAKLTGDDWGYGWNAGILLEPGPATRIGLAYRSKIDLTLKGDARITGPVVDFTTNAKLDVTLPSSLSLSGQHALNSKWTLLADVTWTKWNELEELRVKLNNGSQSVTPLEWDNSIRVALGASYQYNPAWLLRTGVAYDQSPVPSDNVRTPRVPDADRYWLSFGANYRYSEALSFDFGYAHLFVDDPDITSADAYDPTTGQSTGFHKLDGSYDAAVDIFSAQVNWKF